MKFYLTVILSCLSLLVMAQAQDADRRRNFNLINDVALREFDPVSYFQNKPTKGDSKFQFKYKGIYYYFSSEANLEEFKKTPGKYEPAYGGWCAYTVALNGDRVKINPVTYKIVNGKLHLFYNFNGDNRLLKWEKDEKKLKAAADKNWQRKMH
jgi:YHS domain-containing protein